jgi:uncharacterized protein YdgA (DUF945 family)
VSRRTWIPLILVVLLLGYPAAAWLIGMNAESQWEKREQILHEQYPALDIVKHDFHRGVYSSTEEITYRFAGPAAKNLQSLATSLQWPELQFVVRNQIHHGPWPQMRTFAPATVDTEVILPPQVHDKLIALLGDKAQLTLHTRLNWGGGSTTELHSPAFENAQVKWQGLDGTTQASKDLKSAQGAVQAPGLAVKTDKGVFSFETLQLQSDQQIALQGLTVGSINLTLAAVRLADKVGMQHVGLQGKSSLQGDYARFNFGLTSDSIQLQEYQLTRVGYEFGATHLYAPALIALNQALRDSNMDPANPAAGLAKLQQAVNTHGVDLLTHEPVLEIPRIGFAMPEGELLVSLKAQAPGLTREELQGAPNAWQMAMLRHADATADIRIDTALLTKLMASTGKTDQVTPQLEALEKQGYVKIDGNALTTHLAFQHGRLTVNELPFPPVGGMQQPAQPPGPPAHPTPRPRHH